MIKPGQRWMYTVLSNGNKYLIEVVKITDKEWTSCRFLWSSDPKYRCGTVGDFYRMPNDSDEHIGTNTVYTLLEGQERPAG